MTIGTQSVRKILKSSAPKHNSEKEFSLRIVNSYFKSAIASHVIQALMGGIHTQLWVSGMHSVGCSLHESHSAALCDYLKASIGSWVHSCTARNCVRTTKKWLPTSFGALLVFILNLMVSILSPIPLM